MLTLDIVTPVKNFLQGAKVNQVTIPTSSGEIQVLPDHVDLLTILGPGILKLTSDGVEKRFAISYGFAEIKNNRVLVLAETCEESSDIDVERAKRAQKKAEEALSGALTPEHFRKYQTKLQRAIVRQSL